MLGDAQEMMVEKNATSIGVDDQFTDCAVSPAASMHI
jgi:hypothetical protein